MLRMPGLPPPGDTKAPPRSQLPLLVPPCFPPSRVSRAWPRVRIPQPPLADAPPPLARPSPPSSWQSGFREAPVLPDLQLNSNEAAGDALHPVCSKRKRATPAPLNGAACGRHPSRGRLTLNTAPLPTAATLFTQCHLTCSCAWPTGFGSTESCPRACERSVLLSPRSHARFMLRVASYHF